MTSCLHAATVVVAQRASAREQQIDPRQPTQRAQLDWLVRQCNHVKPSPRFRGDES
jgi:hypothetical protein